MSKTEHLSDDAKINLIDALAGEVLEHGQAEAEIIASSNLTDEEANVLMKTNTLLVAFALLLLEVVERRDVVLAKSVLDIWTSDKLQDIIVYAFNDEIGEANKALQDGIAELELLVNKQGE